MKQHRHIPLVRDRDISFEIPHRETSSPQSASERRFPAPSTVHLPNSLRTQSAAPISSIASYLGPRKLMEIGCTPDDLQPGLSKRIEPCSAEFRVTR